MFRKQISCSVIPYLVKSLQMPHKRLSSIHPSVLSQLMLHFRNLEQLLEPILSIIGQKWVYYQANVETKQPSTPPKTGFGFCFFVIFYLLLDSKPLHTHSHTSKTYTVDVTIELVNIRVSRNIISFTNCLFVCFCPLRDQ